MDKNTNKNPQRSKPQLESTSQYDDKILIQGYLKKKSHNKIMKKISMQVAYCIDTLAISYFICLVNIGKVCENSRMLFDLL